MSLQWTFFLLLVLTWAYYLAAIEWNRHLRETVVRALSFGILILSAAVIFGFVTKLRVPFWPHVNEFGFFPNRNQTSNVLGLGAIMIYALGLQRFQEGRRYWWLWLASLSLVCWALIIDGSRAGIVLFFLGALAVHIYWWLSSTDRRQTMVALGGLTLLIILFVIDGGATLLRFTRESAGFFEMGRNLRIAILRDAVHLIAQSSPFGIGLGNFWPVFAVHRHYSFNVSQTAHPESDWTWGAIDLGWLGLIVAVAIFCWWLVQCPPFQSGTNRLIRVAAMVCGIAFAAHGLFDVSGHRLGALWPALLLGAMAINPAKGYRQSAIVPIIFRIMGAILLAVGVWWISSIYVNTPPTTATVDRLRAKVNGAITSGNFTEAKAIATSALRVVPLDWLLYYKRGVAEAALFDSRSLVERDFAVARYLLPNWPDLYLQQGIVWINLGEPDLAFSVWEEGMHRLPDNTASLYADMFGAVREDVDLRDRWRKLADDKANLVLTFLTQANETEFQMELQELLADNEQLAGFSAKDLKRLFALWYQKGDKLWLAETLKQRADWQKIAWPELARSYADYQDYRQAFETAAAFLDTPAWGFHSSQSSAELALQFQANPEDADTGVALISALASEGKTDAALSTLVVVRSSRSAPKNLAMIEAHLWANKKEWQRAWQAAAPLVPGD